MSFLANVAVVALTAGRTGAKKIGNGLPGAYLLPPSPPAPIPVAQVVTTLPPSAGGVPSIPSRNGTPLSMLGDIGRAIAPAVGGWLGSYFPGVGSAGGTAIGGDVARISAQRSIGSPIGNTAGVMNTMASLPSILGAGAGMVVGAVSLGARTVARSAITYCRRHPAWCAQIGGTSAIAAMISGGQLPPIKRRRARGISASQFRAFRRVHQVLSGFCAPRMRIRRGK